MLPPALRVPVTRLTYPLLAASLLLAQSVFVMLVARATGPDHALDEPFRAGWSIPPDAELWLLPMRAAARLGLSAPAAGAVFAALLALVMALALVSYQRAALADRGYVFAALTIVPIVQLPAALVLAMLPARQKAQLPSPDGGFDTAAVIQGAAAGIGLILLAVIVSALAFGAYGWGLFVLTPFLVGLTTGYIANRHRLLTMGRTVQLVLLAALLGTLALVALALEGIICVVLASPLGAGVAALGGVIGRAIAQSRHGGSTPAMCCALLPAVLAFDAAMPPSIHLMSEDSIEIAAPPAEVWRVLTSAEPIRPAPGFVFQLGLAYPLRARMSGEGAGSERIGEFSTGTARERITEWRPGAALAFDVIEQPPAMIELSPYENVHAPHVSGYFETRSTRFELEPLADGGTRLLVRSTHELRLDPALYWEPVARWAISANTSRVLAHIRQAAERSRS